MQPVTRSGTFSFPLAKKQFEIKMSSSGHRDPPAVLHCRALPASFHTFAQKQHFHFTCSSWFRLMESLLISLRGVILWNVLWPHKDEREVGLLWFTAGAKAARNLYLSSAQYIKNMGRFATRSMLLGVFCLSAALEGWIGKRRALK